MLARLIILFLDVMYQLVAKMFILSVAAVCRAGYYVSEEGECLLCPNNSDSKEQQAMSCDCKEGYYRYPLEADQPCYCE